ncbi:iron chelate uptake ABC transporter family permease subunit [Streptomyces sp. NPDC002589]|uniref:FecCD family ABC transporter permease n=1 Tax=Streptomyces sp. NPDC002589 TaxID=3154420 RepID=UPI00331F27A7
MAGGPAPWRADRLEPVLRDAADHGGLPVVVHGFAPTTAEDLRTLAAPSRRHPRIPLVVGRLGGLHWMEAVEPVRDTPARVGECGLRPGVRRRTTRRRSGDRARARHRYDEVPRGPARVSVAGGLAAAALVYALAWRRGIQAGRFVLVGVGIGVALSAVVQLYLAGSELDAAEQVKLWLTGSLNGRGWEQAGPQGAVLALCLPGLIWAGRAARPPALGDETAAGLGVRVDRTRLAPTVLGVVLAATATGAAGPIGFVALTAPQPARRLTRTPHLPLPLLCSALTGALVLVTADLAARTLLSPLDLPVGALTALVGGPYLLWLLGRGPRQG